MLREMRSTDLDAVINMGRDIYAGNALRSLEFDDEKAAVFITRVMGRGFAVVYERGGQVVGAMLGDAVAPWFSPDLMGVEYFLMVEPEHRGGSAAPMLIQAWETWCESMGAKIARLAVESEYEQADRLYSRIGYRRAGGNYFRELGDG